MIKVCDVRFSYGPAGKVLDRVSVDIGSGLSLLLGPNGAGKSTLLKVIAGVERPDSGRIEIEGFDLWQDEVAARQSLAYVPEYPDMTPYATIRDVIALVCRLRSEPIEKGLSALERAGLAHAPNRSIRELSMGQRRRAVMAAAWIGRPRVVLLDEPLESMDRWIRGHILSWVDDLIAGGASVLVATHQIEPFIEKAQRVVTVRNGACAMLEPLPGDSHQRRQLIERSL